MWLVLRLHICCADDGQGLPCNGTVQLVNHSLMIILPKDRSQCMIANHDACSGPDCKTPLLALLSL
jgi:hypothetical protein